MCFCNVSKVVVNSKILIISGAPIRVIFQNSVTYNYMSEIYSVTSSQAHDCQNAIYIFPDLRTEINQKIMAMY